ncbi:MAG: autotransporter domain-containing protein [Akkermansia sp.]|nr:autotransporter domain-containing protein [Akkermansia sp.]
MKINRALALLISCLVALEEKTVASQVSVDGQFVQLVDDKSAAGVYEHLLERVDTGTQGGTLNVYYNGLDAAAASYTDILHVVGNGDLVLEGTSTNTLQLFRLADGAADDFEGNLTICNYSAAWDGDGRYDNAVILESGGMNMKGSLTLDVAGYCAEDCLFVVAFGVNGDVCVGGLDAPEYIAPAAYLYSGNLKEDTTSMEHSCGLAFYIARKNHTLTIDAAGRHSFYGDILGPLTVVKKGAGTQSFVGALDSGCSFRVLGGVLNLISDAELTTIEVNNATLNYTGSLAVQELTLESGTLTVSGNLSTGEACFSGSNSVSARAVAVSWELQLNDINRQSALLSLSDSSEVTLQSLDVVYCREDMLRGWYCLVENSAGLQVNQVLANGDAMCTESRGGDMWGYVADGWRTLPRTESASLVWLPESGNWIAGSGHVELSWAGPDTNSNFLAGDEVCITHPAEINLVGELLPGRVVVGNADGVVSMKGTGCISGAAELEKSGAGELVVATANDYTGGSTLTGGTLTTLHSSALGSGDVTLRGGVLNLAGRIVENAIRVQGDVAIVDGNQYQGKLALESGVLSGGSLRLAEVALLKGGTVDMELTGTGGIQVQGEVKLCKASSYTGNSVVSSGCLTIEHARALGEGSVVMQGGRLELGNLAIANSIQVRGDAILSHAGNYTGCIDLQSGSLRLDAVGSARIICSGNAELRAEDVLHLSRQISNSGTLSLEGVFDLTALAVSRNAELVDVYGNAGGNSGFQRDAGTFIELTNGCGSIGGSATFLFRGSAVELGADGRCEIGAGVHYGQYHVGAEHSVSVSTIRSIAGNALQSITMSGGRLLVDESARVASTGGELVLTSGELSGSCSNCALTATGGLLNTSFSGENRVSGTASVRLAGIISNTGNLTLLGEFDASALPLQEDEATRIGGSSPASGYAQSSACSLQVVRGGSVSAGAVMLHGEHRLVLGADGYAVSGGEVDYSEYVLTGSDTARYSEICQPGLERIEMTGGVLVVDADTDAVTSSAGTVILENGSLGGNICGSACIRVTGTGALTGANTHNGGVVLEDGVLTISSAEALGSGGICSSGNSSLCIEGFTLALVNPIENSGCLRLSGCVDATALAQYHAATMVDAYGNLGGASGFMQDAGCEVNLLTGGTLDAHDATILLHGLSITPDSSGHAGLPGMLHTDVYTVTGEHCVSVSAIATAAGQGVPEIRMDSGILVVDKNVDTLQVSGGLVQIQSAWVGGNIGGNARVEILGDAVLRSANSYSGGTTVAAGSLQVQHAQALGSGMVYLGSKGRGMAPLLDLKNLAVENHLELVGNSELRGLEKFSGSITMKEGAEVTIQKGEVLNLSTGQTLTLAPGGNTIHGHVNLDGGTIVITGGALTLNGVANFSKPTTLDLSNWDASSGVVVVLDFPSAYDEELLELVLPDGLADGDVSFDPQTGALHVNMNDGADSGSGISLAPMLNRNQRAAYEALRLIDPAQTSGELAVLAETVAASADVDAMRELMDRVNGAGYTSLLNSVVDDALSYLEQLHAAAGTAQRLPGEHGTAVAIHAYNQTGSVSGTPGYDYSSWGGRLMVEHQVRKKLCLGVAMGNGAARITPDGDETHTDTVTHLDAYALYADAGWRFLFSAGVGMHEFSMARRLQDGTSAEVAPVSGCSINFGVQVSRAIPLNAQSVLQPCLAIQTVTAAVDSYHESGSTASLYADAQRADLAEVALGLRYETKCCESLLLGVHGALTAIVGDTESELELHFADAPAQSFRVYGAERQVIGYRFGASLSLPLGEDCMLHSSVTGRMQGHAQMIDSQLGIVLYF